MKKRSLIIYEAMGVLGLFALAWIIRVWGIGSSLMNHDEASWVRAVIGMKRFIEQSGLTVALKSTGQLFTVDWLRLFIVKYLSDTGIGSIERFMFYLRLPSLIAGSLTVVLLYFLTKHLYSKTIAFITSLFLCFLPWHIIYSRFACRLIWLNFFGALVFLSIIIAYKSKEKLTKIFWAAIALYFLLVSQYSYPSAVLFIPMVAAMFFIMLYKANFSRTTKLAIVGLIVIFGTYIARWHTFGFFRTYHKNIFEGNILINLIDNIKTNLLVMLRSLFFYPKDSIVFYAPALRVPLLIFPVTIALFILGLVRAVQRNQLADKIVIIWFSIGLLGAASGVNLVQARYLFIILIPAIILISIPIGELIARAFKFKSIRRYLMISLAAIVVGGIISIEAVQWARYKHKAPYDIDEWVYNSYGCKQAAQFLQEIPNIERYSLGQDNRMTVSEYLNLYLGEQGRNFNDSCFFTGNCDRTKTYWALWSSKSYFNKVWLKGNNSAYESFKEKEINASLIKTIYYPDGVEAVNIFEVKHE